jgi:transposase
MDAFEYFADQNLVIKKKYDALRDFFFLGKKAEEVAKTYGYKLSAFYSLTRDFNAYLKSAAEQDYFFRNVTSGRKHQSENHLDELIISLRKRNLSTEDILTTLHSKGYKISYQYVYQLLKREGFAKLTRRNNEEKRNKCLPKIKAEKTVALIFSQEEFVSQSVSLLFFRVLIQEYGISDIIAKSQYPQTKTINRLSSILSFLALKLSDVRRYSCDDIWCMDRGAGLFAGLNVLPKTAWFSSYSHRVTKDMNHHFLKQMYNLWVEKGLISDSVNLDFTTIPYWGDDQHLENNWSGKRNKAMSSMLAVLAQDPDSGIITYGDADRKHDQQSDTVIQFLDFYPFENKNNTKLNWVIFDSKFTTYQNLSKLNSEHKIKFITIRSRGKKELERIKNIPAAAWKKTRVVCGDGKNRVLYALDETIQLKDYQGDMRQVVIKGHGKIKPALIITNDFDLKIEVIIRKYAKRWIVEKCISEQIEFFHLNRVSSSMVIKVDFDLTMTILAHNIYRLFADRLDRYSKMTSTKLYEKFIRNSGIVKIEEDKIVVSLKKKRELPMLLEKFNNSSNVPIADFHNRKIIFKGNSTT